MSASGEKWTARAVLDALWDRFHREAALVPEVVLTDPFFQTARQAAYAQQHPRYAAKHYPDAPEFTDEHQAYLLNGKPQRRIDVLMVNGRQLTSIEIKVTRADFRAETDEKRRAWRAATNRFVYAVPAGLVQPEEVPDGVGLWWANPVGSGLPRIEVMRRARVNTDPSLVANQVFIALAYRCGYKPVA